MKDGQKPTLVAYHVFEQVEKELERAEKDRDEAVSIVREMREMCTCLSGAAAALIDTFLSRVGAKEVTQPTDDTDLSRLLPHRPECPGFRGEKGCWCGKGDDQPEAGQEIRNDLDVALDLIYEARDFLPREACSDLVKRMGRIHGPMEEAMTDQPPCVKCGGPENSLVHNGKRFNVLYDHQFQAPPCEWTFEGGEPCGDKLEQHVGAKPFWSHPYTVQVKP